MQRQLTREQVEALRRQHPPGSRITLNRMEDDPDPIPPGTEGKLVYIDDAGQYQVAWSNGRSLAVIPGVDSFTVQPPKERQQTADNPQKETQKPAENHQKQTQKPAGTHKKKAQRTPQR